MFVTGINQRLSLNINYLSHNLISVMPPPLVTKNHHPDYPTTIHCHFQATSILSSMAWVGVLVECGWVGLGV